MIKFSALSLFAKIAGGAALVVILTLATLWQLSERRADRLESKLEATRADLAQCRENVSTLEASLEAQNTAIQSVSDQGQARIAESTERLTERDTERTAAMEREARLRDAPPVGDSLCEAVLRSLDDVLED